MQAKKPKLKTWQVTFTVHCPDWYLESDVTETCEQIMDGEIKCPSDYDVVNVQAVNERS